MMNYFVIFIFVVATGCAPSPPSPELPCGFYQNSYGQRISWDKNSQVTMYLHTSVPESMIPSILAAADTWNAEIGYQAIVIVTDHRVVKPYERGRDGRNVIYFMTVWNDDDLRKQALTSIHWFGSSMSEGDIRINGERFGYYSEYGALSYPANELHQFSSLVNLEALVLHEFGHVLGLAHAEDQSSVMNAYLSSNSDRVNLDQAVKTSLKCEY